VATLRRTASRLNIEVVGFSDLSIEEVASECGISLLQARLAKLREYSEPFRIRDATPGAISRLFKGLRAGGLVCARRGAYYEVGVTRQDVGAECVRILYGRAFGEILLVAFGDYSGAAPLLRHADVPLVVQSSRPEETAQLLTDVPAARLSVADSITTWAEVVLDIATTHQSGTSIAY
jgi:mannosyl-3-phosphoglycerate phosphatase